MTEWYEDALDHRAADRALANHGDKPFVTMQELDARLGLG